ncbi:amidohydrolase family protein [Nocardiopsis sp. SBT366]|uniref:amidohydrolase family protein n=1 Tax=Nocardiopsis sp. SBT366 TaxID=1580529 RepID=UPI00066DEB36|nr:amidohydrolase family protein [Nocardiopsis sp. SBT366]
MTGISLAPEGDEETAIRRIWGGLGLPGLVDVHTHFMPDNVLRKVQAYFDALGEGVWPLNPRYRVAEDERVALLRGFGVLGFTALSYPHRPAMAAWLNDWAADFADRHPDSLRSATFFAEPEAADYVADAIGSGARVFKAHLQVGAYDPRDPLLSGVWGALADSGTPVVVHCGSGPTPGNFTGPGPFAEVLRQHPALTAVVAHAGAPEYSAFLDLVEGYEGVHLDTTMTFTPFTERQSPFPREELPRLREFGHRVLLGTDFPNIPYPYLDQIRSLVELDLGEDWLRGVLHDNAAALFDLPTRPGRTQPVADTRQHHTERARWNSP